MLLKKQIPLYYTIVSALLGGVITFFVFSKEDNEDDDNKQVAKSSALCKYEIARLGGYSYIKPLLFTDKDCESDKLESIKLDITNIIDEENEKDENNVTSVSVYVRDFTTGEWISFNQDATYNPGSLSKVPILMTYLRMAELNPNLLNEERTCDKSCVTTLLESFPAQTIQAGRKYTVKELLYSMITNSDNSATYLLLQTIDLNLYKKTFTDLGLPVQEIDNGNYFITAKQYSIFMRVLYNATYLNISSSEFAMDLLCKSVFKEGLAKSLPSKVEIAHKFGEAGTNLQHQLHESGIIYLNEHAYLITVMTKGADVKKLAKVMSSISETVYKKMSA